MTTLLQYCSKYQDIVISLCVKYKFNKALCIPSNWGSWLFLFVNSLFYSMNQHVVKRGSDNHLVGMDKIINSQVIFLSKLHSIFYTSLWIKNNNWKERCQ